MARVQSWMMWVAGLLAILGAIGLARLPLKLFVIEIDVLMPIAALLCFAVAYAMRKDPATAKSPLVQVLWVVAAAALLTVIPLVSLPLDLTIARIDALQLLVGFACLLIAYVKTWKR
jgi:drug/metabolite transporter (DMT)-like permease